MRTSSLRGISEGHGHALLFRRILWQRLLHVEQASALHLWLRALRALLQQPWQHHLWAALQDQQTLAKRAHPRVYTTTSLQHCSAHRA
jgi:hypothetical protein